MIIFVDERHDLFEYSMLDLERHSKNRLRSVFLSPRIFQPTQQFVDSNCSHLAPSNHGTRCLLYHRKWNLHGYQSINLAEFGSHGIISPGTFCLVVPGLDVSSPRTVRLQLDEYERFRDTFHMGCLRFTTPTFSPSSKYGCITARLATVSSTLT